jgi:hypothetical protein
MRPSPTAVLLGMVYMMAWMAPCMTAGLLGFAAGVGFAQQHPGLPRLLTAVLAARAAVGELLARHLSSFL